MTAIWRPRLGACYLGERRCRFRVWAPWADRVRLHIVEPNERWEELREESRGYHSATLDAIEPGTRYLYELTRDGRTIERPDPASRFQPTTVHEASEVVDPLFAWNDAHWHGLPLERFVFYELHVGTFTPEGTFDAVIPHLARLADLGVTAIELLPVAQFSGQRGWGYDGVYPFAVQNSYGGPDGLRRLVDACHEHQLAVVLDVVYNHLGPEGCYFQDFGPYFTPRHRTPWGDAINWDGRQSDEVRRFFIENLLYWVHEFHIDAFRLDAVRAIYDDTEMPFLAELVEHLERHAVLTNRHLFAIGESNLNDPRWSTPRELNGIGLHSQWVDDFHHSLFTLLTPERDRYYRDFGSFEDFVTAYKDGFAHSGRYSHYRGRRQGRAAGNHPGHRFTVCIQNHDQIGNRPRGERLTTLVSFETQKLAVGTTLLAPYLPLMFMGEEYGETAPFLYFIDFSSPELVEGVRRGRREEYSFDVPGFDPQDVETFLRSKLNHDLRNEGRHGVVFEYVREVLRLRRELPALRWPDRERMALSARYDQRVLISRRWEDDDEIILAMNLSDQPQAVTYSAKVGRWWCVLNSADERWMGPGSSAPREWQSNGIVTIELMPSSLLLFALDTSETM